MEFGVSFRAESQTILLTEAAMFRFTSRRVALAIVISLLLAAGCYESKFTLGPKSKAVFNPVYLGDWQTANTGAWANCRIVIRNWEDHMYYVEWGKAGEEPLRMSGFVVKVKGVSFAHLRPLSENDSSSERYLLFRMEFSRDRLLIRPLNEKFFEDKPVYSSEQLRSIVEENLDNDRMYDKDNTVSAVHTMGFARAHSPTAPDAH